MKRIDKIRAREAARVCLIESRNMLQIAADKMLATNHKNLRVREDFKLMFELHDRLVFFVVDEQGDER